jgi:hypothetical protein
MERHHAYGAHGDGVDWVVSWNHEAPLAIAQDQMTGFADDPIPQLDKHPHGFLLTDPR